VLYSPGRIDAMWHRTEALLKSRGVTIAPFEMRREVGARDLADALRLRRWVRRQAPFEIIHAHSSKAGALVRLAFPARRDKVYTPNAFATMSRTIGPRKRAAYAAFERVLARSGGVTVVVSEDELAHARGLRLPDTKLRLVPMGVPTRPTGDRAAARAELGLSEDEIVIGFVGRFWDQKDPVTAVRAFARYARDHAGTLVMVGYGDGVRDVRETAAAEGIEDRVRIVLDGDAPLIIPAFDVLLLTSGYESFGYVLLEAVVNGVPCVSTPVGIAPTLARDGAARLFEIGDAEGAAAALIQTLHGDARETRTQSARSAAEAFSDTAMHQGVRRVYEELRRR
ncbi:glycosyltransferase, partial [bacterium]